MSGSSENDSYSVRFEESEFWLNRDDERNALFLEYRSLDLYAPIKKAKDVLEGEEDKILLKELMVNDEGEIEALDTDVEFRRTSSGNSVIVGESQLFSDNHDEYPLIAPKSQIKDLIEGEIDGVNLSFLKGA